MTWSIIVVEPALSWLHDLRRTDRPERTPARFGRGKQGKAAVRVRPTAQAVILVGGDKAGNWRGWYRTAVPLAETVYSDHLNRIAKEGGER